MPKETSKRKRQPLFFKRPKAHQSDQEIEDEIVSSMFDTVNRERKSKGLPPLKQPKKS